MNSILSKKFYAFNLILIVAVLFLHSQSISNRIQGFQPTTWNFIIQGFITGMCQIAVPAFFIVSGYFFFDKKMVIQDFKKKIYKRCKTVAMPFLVTSALSITFFAFIQIFPFAEKFFNNGLIKNYSLKQLFQTLFFFPLAYQLWFLRNLFCAVLLSPLFYVCIKKGTLFYITIVSIFYIFSSEKIPYHIVDTITFFSIGGYLKIDSSNIEVKEQKFVVNTLLLLSWIFLVVASLFLRNSEAQIILLNISVFTGIPYLWNLLNNKNAEKLMVNKFFQLLMPFSFFIFLFHEPILTILIKAMFSLFGNTDQTSILSFFLTPIIAILLCVITGAILRRYFQPIYKIITGNR